MAKERALTYNEELVNDKTANALIGVLFFIMATALGAYVRIPVKAGPVPITLQTFFVMLSGAILGRRLAGWSQLGYVALGAFGLPIFQGLGRGIPYLLGPTGGYLIGFIFAASLIGRMVQSKNSDARWIALSFVVGDLIIHGLGTSWLMLLYRMDSISAVSAGILPFIPGEIIKIFFAATIYSGISQRSKTIFSA